MPNEKLPTIHFILNGVFYQLLLKCLIQFQEGTYNKHVIKTDIVVYGENILYHIEQDLSPFFTKW